MTLTHPLAWLDELLQREVRRLRSREQIRQDELRGLYVSDERVERLLAQPAMVGGTSVPEEDVTAALLDLPRWAHLTDRLSLNRFERATLLLALAPEADLKYEAIYGYLNNDLTRKWPVRELALRLFTPAGEDPASLRHLLAAQAPLFRAGLLRPVPQTPEHLGWLSGGFVLDPMVAHFLLGGEEPAAHLTAPLQYSRDPISWDEVPVAPPLCAALQRLPGVIAASRDEPPLVVFDGRPGSGQTEAVAALAQAHDVGLVRIDIRALRNPAERLPEVLVAAALHQLLYGSLLFVDGVDALAESDVLAPAVGKAIVSLIEASHGLVVVASEASRHTELVGGHRTITMQFHPPTAPDRLQLWSAEAQRHETPLTQELSRALAERFILTPGQIHSAYRRATDMMALSDTFPEPGTDKYNDPNALFEAARAQTRINIGSLAMKAATTHSWDDLVLPETTLRQVREVAAAIRYRGVVYDEWGFAGRLTRGRGLTALFSGVSGTGKTMAAAIVAKELGVDLYTIDLSSVVSKYIGETEKNLDRVFRAAHQSNAILFFDEADALFGKRSEVKDAHDRYANIEVAYLLQKMEEHEGAVILATNLSRNIDQAFSRRVQYVVEFPLPSEMHRERLWRGMFPPTAPLDDTVDFPFLAKQFEIAGGDIRNVALDAAFLAAQNGRVVTMHHLVVAMARQVRKQGRTASATDFKHYFMLIAQE